MIRPPAIESIPPRRGANVIWVAVIIAILLLLGGFLLNLMIWLAVPALLIVALAFVLAWARRTA